MKLPDWALLIGGAVLIVLLSAFVPAYSCPYETEEARITENIAPTDKYFIIDGEKLDLFVKNANNLYNIGWQRQTITKIYAIDAEIKSQNPNFQIVHLFFIAPDGCIAYYQTAYKAVVDLMLDPDPAKKLGLTP